MNEFDNYIKNFNFECEVVGDIIRYRRKDINQEITFCNDDKSVIFENLNAFNFKELSFILNKCKELGWDKEEKNGTS